MKQLNEWIRLVATPQDKELLRQIAAQDGDPGQSATVRRLIRDEARRRGLIPPAGSTPPHTATPQSA